MCSTEKMLIVALLSQDIPLALLGLVSFEWDPSPSSFFFFFFFWF
jgi:hypothetical protein